jgi:hypothetical protein
MSWLRLGVGGAILAVVVLAVVPERHRRSVPTRPGGKPIRVEVLNGSGVNRAGLAVAEDLRERGFDVVDIRNADRSDYAQTVVLDRVGVPEYALAVASEIGVGNTLEEPNGGLLLEVTVILGRDRGERYGGSL